MFIQQEEIKTKGVSEGLEMRGVMTNEQDLRRWVRKGRGRCGMDLADRCERLTWGRRRDTSFPEPGEKIKTCRGRAISVRINLVMLW